jgi:hypothetical protein
MRTKLGIGLLILLALAIVALPATSAPSPAGSRDDDDEVEVIRVLATTVQEADLDLGAQGDSLGDQFIFSDDLSRRGEKVGIDGGHCTLVRLEPRVSATLQCLVTADLPKGQITAQGLITFTEETEGEPFRIAITGGTGRYKEAHGHVKVDEESETEARLTFHVIR